MTAARPLSGRWVLGVSAAIFAVVLGANLTLAYFAVHTFSGLVVDNGYVASQSFDRDKAAQDALGWTLAASHEAASPERGVMRIEIVDAQGRPVHPPKIAVVVGRPTMARSDLALDLHETPRGYVAEAALAPGNWLVMIDAVAANGVRYHRREPLILP